MRVYVPAANDQITFDLVKYDKHTSTLLYYDEGDTGWEEWTSLEHNLIQATHFRCFILEE